MNFLHPGSLLQPENPFKPNNDFAAETVATLEGISMRKPTGTEGSEWVPSVDILEDSAEYLFKADVPEMKKADIRVLVETDVLLITGTRNLENQENGKKSLRIERPHGYFVRRFALPDDASRAEMKVRFTEGVLRVQVPKVPRIKRKEHIGTRSTQRSSE